MLLRGPSQRVRIIRVQILGKPTHRLCSELPVAQAGQRAKARRPASHGRAGSCPFLWGPTDRFQFGFPVFLLAGF